MNDYRYFPCELHSHTVHSDGDMTPDELMREAKDIGLSLIALTDHNTASGLTECDPDYVIPGIEWTTYHGHMTVLGAKRFVDWREAKREELDPSLREIKAAGALCAVAHPFCEGSPVCTGCAWEYIVKDPALLDAIEIWSTEDPPFQPDMPDAVRMWQTMLDCGYHVAPFYGRDWHSPRRDRRNAVTCIAAEGEITPEKALSSLRKGRCAVTMGPAPDFRLTRLHQEYLPGDVCPPGSAAFSVTLRGMNPVWDARWQAYGMTFDTVRIVGAEGKTLLEAPLLDHEAQGEIKLPAEPIRAEIWGTLDGRPCALALTGAIYCEYPTLICAHAGAENTQDNTLASINQILSVGCDALEIDVRPDEQGELYLSHNPLPEGAPRATLEQCFQLLAPWPKMKINCDMKQSGQIIKVIALADQYGLQSRLIFTGACDDGDIAAMRDLAPWSHWHNIEDWLPRTALENALASGCHCVNASYRKLRGNTRRMFKDNGIMLSLWTVNKRAPLKRAIAAQIHSITTRKPRLAMKLREEYWDQI